MAGEERDGSEESDRGSVVHNARGEDSIDVLLRSLMELSYEKLLQ